MADMLDVINAIFDDSGDEEDFEGFDEEAVEEAARRLLNLQDDSDEENEPAAVWRSNEGVVRQMPDLPEFLENERIKVAVPEDQAPVSYFHLFFTDDIIGGILTDTKTTEVWVTQSTWTIIIPVRSSTRTCSHTTSWPVELSRRIGKNSRRKS